MTNRFDEQVVRDDMLETLVGGTQPSMDELLTDLDSQIHEFDKNGPRYPPGPHGLADIFKFTYECEQWRIDHPDFHYRPIPQA